MIRQHMQRCPGVYLLEDVGVVLSDRICNSERASCSCVTCMIVAALLTSDDTYVHTYVRGT